MGSGRVFLWVTVWYMASALLYWQLSLPLKQSLYCGFSSVESSWKYGAQTPFTIFCKLLEFLLMKKIQEDKDYKAKYKLFRAYKIYMCIGGSFCSWDLVKCSKTLFYPHHKWLYTQPGGIIKYTLHMTVASSKVLLHCTSSLMSRLKVSLCLWFSSV